MEIDNRKEFEENRRNGLEYKLTEEEINQYDSLGYLVLEQVLTESEMQTLDPWFDRIISGEGMDRMRRDFCDMSQPYGTPFEDFQLINAMSPSIYFPEFAGNIFQKITQNIADQLYQKGKAGLDYEQFLAKKPTEKKAEFAMHQDLGYWPKTKNTWTATFSLALNDAHIINGCLYIIPGSNKEPELRTHKPKEYDNKADDISINRDDSHTLVITSKPDDKMVYLPIKRGGITIHDERIVHGSGGNNSENWRKTYIAAYRDIQTIAEERAIGFTHSHNDTVDWNNIIE